MNMRDLIPWGRQSSSNAPAMYRDEQSNPIVGFRREVDRLFDDLFRWPSTSFGPSFGSAGRALAWPNLEVNETDRELRITAEVPGMSEKDVELLVEDGILTLRGEKKSETEDRGYSERWYGRFERRIGASEPLRRSGVPREPAAAGVRTGGRRRRCSPGCAGRRRPGRPLPASAGCAGRVRAPARA